MFQKHCPSTRDGFSNKHDLFYQPFKNWDIRWNWEKFLIDRSGMPYMRYDASSEPLENISPDIDRLLMKISN
jgi:glutathione peroxidase